MQVYLLMCWMEFPIIIDTDAFDLKMSYPYEKKAGMQFLALKPLITARPEFSVDTAQNSRLH